MTKEDSTARSWPIAPYVGLGELRFGMLRDSVRTLVGNGFETFLKTPTSVAPADAYDALGLHLYYDAALALEFIETFEPFSPSVEGVQLLSRPVADVVTELRGLGHVHQGGEPSSPTFESLGLALYAPGGIVEGASVFRRGYYGD